MTVSTLLKTVAEIEAEPDRDMRSDMLIEISERFAEVPGHIAVRPYPESAKVPSCESQAYVFADLDNQKRLNFYFAVENPQGVSAKSLAVLLAEHLNGETTAEIEQLSEEIVYKIFGYGISMGKGEGLKSMVRMVKALARNVAFSQ